MLCVVSVVTTMVIGANIGAHNISFSFFHFHLLEFHFYPHSLDFFSNFVFFLKLNQSYFKVTKFLEF